MIRVEDQDRNIAYCDLCGRHEERGRPTYECGDGVRWNTTENAIAETHIHCVTGTWERKDGSDGRVKHVSVHLCPACFTTRLVPWLTAQGVTPSILRCDTQC
jgi:hypothetical protein